MTEARTMHPPGEMTNRQLWHWRVTQTPDRRWLWCDGREWTYAEFDVEVRRLAAGLRELGVGPGTRVLIGMTNRPEAVQAHLAVGELGAVCVTLVPGMPFRELAYPIQHSEATVLIADDPIASIVLEHRDACPALEHLVLLGAGGGDDGVTGFAARAATPPLDHEPLEQEDVQALAYIIYTSGSTGRPKGVMLKAGGRYHCGLGYADLYGFTSRDTYFLPLTLGHSLGATAALGIAMVTGGAVALAERFRPSLFWSQVEAGGATVSVLFQAHLSLLLETDDGSVGPGSSPLRLIVTHTYLPEFVERFGVELGTIWGMTETLVCVGSDPGYRGELGPGYVGHPFGGGELGIFDPDLRRVGPYAYGELCLRHPQVMLGYLKDDAATAATLVDGWVRSGDRGFVDHTGRAYFAGRFKAMIKRSGENVSAEEVEAAILTHPDVAECVVVGVPDPIRAEEVGAIVVRRAGADLDPAALRDACGDRLVRWKLPRYIQILDEILPRLGNGKIDRVITAALLDPAVAWDAERERPRPERAGPA
ncbi:MAG: acyl--CoA ligase [Solirubrobacterales bacterium]|nr:acyl--CoA ligase [Solirubrobacterales bacterium]